MRRDPSIAARDILRELAFLERMAATFEFDSFRDDATAYRAAAFAIKWRRVEQTASAAII